ncbi:MAG: Ig-like domain-containing protein, partial [Desulfobacterales bacterium]
LRLIVGLSALFLCACDNSGTTGDTGSISFNLEWKSGVSDESNLVLTANGDVCENYQISTISATVYDATDKNIANKSFACTDHSGSFAGIPAGSGYRIVIKGMVSGNPDWTGQKGGLAVTDGQTTNAGTISMTYSGSDETPPEVLLVSPGISVTSVAVNTSVTAVFNETMNPSSFKATSFLLQNTADNSEIAGSVAYNSASRIATFTPDADLSANTEYRVTLTAMITDIAGNPLPGGGYSWTFFTGDLTCAYSIDPATQTINPAGGSGEITVTASSNACAWTAVSAEPWITITSGDSGTGSGTVQFTVSENTGASPAPAL